ncbi:MAG: hypothetical protein Q9195_000949 [Heterodermia aff. obscurata]
MALQRRLLKDIAELQADPYPNIALHPRDDLKKACLILTPHERDPLHLTVNFGQKYPLYAPQISIQSRVSHPNVFDNYICASILNTREGYTPAYTIKGICIQLLSFFSSDRIEQEGGGRFIELQDYKGRGSCSTSESQYHCPACGFGSKKARIQDEPSSSVPRRPLPFPVRVSLPKVGASKSSSNPVGVAGKSGKTLTGGIQRGECESKLDSDKIEDSVSKTVTRGGRDQHSNKMTTLDRILRLPNEIILAILEELDTGSLVAAARASSEIEQLITSGDFIRLQELQCFCLKESLIKQRLGVGVSVSYLGGQNSLGSEFDLLSLEAFEHHRVRRSVQSIPFQHWLPLPLTRRHWQSVKPLVGPRLKALAGAAKMPPGPDINVIYAFMTNIVVKLSSTVEKTWTRRDSIKSTLRHASEKAIESYFSLFHLLLCLSVAEPQIVREANRRVESFEKGDNSKEMCPNLGHLLTLTLISDHGLTPSLSLAIIREAVIRNVVWMLDKKGSNMPELCYLEPTPVSEFRMQRTFEASKTSYRILMFQALFAKIARPTNTPISTICDEIFDRHGAPPLGTAELLAKDIRQLQSIDSFPEFFKVMGVEYDPGSTEFPSFLKESITLSVKKGYSKLPIKQDKALGIRTLKEPDVECVKGLVADDKYAAGPRIGLSFFSGKGKKGR